MTEGSVSRWKRWARVSRVEVAKPPNGRNGIVLGRSSCPEPQTTMASRSEPSEASSRGKGVYGKQKFLRMEGYAKIRSILQPPYEQDHNYSICPCQNEYGNQMWSSNTIVPHSVHDGWTVRNNPGGGCIVGSCPQDVLYAHYQDMSY